MLKPISLAVLSAISIFVTTPVQAGSYYLYMRAPAAANIIPTTTGTSPTDTPQEPAKDGIVVTLNTLSLPGGRTGKAYAGISFQQALAISGDSSPTPTSATWTAAGLVSGLSLASTGELQGTPSATGSFPFTATVTYKGHSASRAYILVVNNPKELRISPAVSGKTTWDLDDDGPLVLSAYGAYSISSAASLKVSVKAWGAAGGGGMSSATACSTTGGAGGFAGGSVSLETGAQYLAWVGQGGGHVSDAASFGGGGKVVTAASGRYAGNGGGLSGLFYSSATQPSALVIAAGGGGGGSTRGGAGDQAGEANASVNSTAGKAGTPTAGGAAGASGGGYNTSGPKPGSALSGGSFLSGSYSGGAGGAGYFGGGTGGANNSMGSGGGGGSSFVATSVEDGITAVGNFGTPGLATDLDRGTAGQPGSGSSLTLCSGNPGKLVLRAQ